MLNVVRFPCAAGAIALLSIGASALAAQSGGAGAAALDSIAAAPVRANRTVGLVAAVVKGNDTLLMKGYGKADIEWDVAMPIDAMFEIGSVTKQFTAVAILQLRDAGKLSLDDEITKWFPNLDMRGNKVTLRRMLSHTSGINDFTNVDEWEMGFFNPVASRDSLARYIKLDPFRFPTGTAQAYSNSAFYLLGLVVEKASGTSYEEYVEKKIFEPLGMTRSMYCNTVENVPRRAHGYSMVPRLQRALMVHYQLVFSAGAICSTAPDLITWLKALHGGKVLSRTSYAEMTTAAKLEDGSTVQYGMGIKVGEDFRGLKYIGHGGTAPGFRADATWYPDAQLAVVVLINTSPAPVSPNSISAELARAVLPWPRPEFRFYTGDAAELVGHYEYVVGGNQPSFFIDVTQTPTGLSFARQGARAERLPWAGGLKFYAQEHVTLTFRRANGDSGPVTELRRDDAGNLYILKKQ